jgi:LPS export ABC transporter protein LptC
MQKPLIFCCLLLLWACQEETAANETVDPAQAEQASGVESFGVEYYFSDSARVSAQLFAAHVTEREKAEVEPESGPTEKKETVHYLDGGVKLNFLNQAGKSHSSITSEEAVFQRKKGIAQLKGNVIMTNYKKESMYTEELWWDQEKDSVFTDKFVRIETPDKVITGSKGLRSNTDFTAYTIYGIQGELETDEN